MALQPYVHVETLEEYGERFKDFAHMERTEDGILFVRLKRNQGCIREPSKRRSTYNHLPSKRFGEQYVCRGVSSCAPIK